MDRHPYLRCLSCAAIWVIAGILVGGCQEPVKKISESLQGKKQNSTPAEVASATSAAALADSAACYLKDHGACVTFSPDPTHQKSLVLARFGKLCEALGGTLGDQPSCPTSYEESCGMGTAGWLGNGVSFSFRLDPAWSGRNTEADKEYVAKFLCTAEPRNVWLDFADNLPARPAAGP